VELWNIGIGTPYDPSDDYRMVPWLLDKDGDATFNLSSIDHTVLDGSDDPYTDGVYWMRPADITPGQTGYLSVEPLMQAQTYAGGTESEVMARMVLVNWNGGSAPPYNADMPETGTIFRVESSKPPIAGIDEFTFQNTILGIEEDQIPNSYSLDQNYPNPFNPSTTIRFNLSERSIVQLNVYNILGQKINTLINGEMNSGQHSVLFNGAGLASGVYFYVLKVDDTFYETKKMILLK
jgi:hypothetical protein